jgi:recombination protein RecA
MKIGSYGNPETTTGGVSLPFYATGRISVRGPESKNRRIMDDTTQEVIGHKTLFEVVKNKLAPPFRSAEVNLIYGKGYDVVWEILDIASSLGIVDKKGAWYRYNDKNFAQGEKNAVSFLKDPTNADMYKTIRENVIDSVGLRGVYERHSQQGPIYS